MKITFFRRQGWLDGYLGNPDNPSRLKNITPEGTKDYKDGWREGKGDSLEDPSLFWGDADEDYIDNMLDDELKDSDDGSPPWHLEKSGC